MLDAQRALMGTPEALLERSTPEDTALTLEVALARLPELEREAEDPSALLVVPAVDERGVSLGEFVIEYDGKTYILTEFAVAHEEGKPCPRH